MKTAKKICMMLVAAISLLGCSQQKTSTESPISVEWQMIENQKGNYLSSFTITNISGSTLDNNWALYYNKMPTKVESVEGEAMSVKPIINNNYLCLYPNDNYKPLAPGESITVKVLSKGSFHYIGERPDGGHVVIGNSDKAIPVDIKPGELTSKSQFSISDKKNYPDGNYVWGDNAISNPEGATYNGTAYDIMPTPKSIKIDSNSPAVVIPSNVKIAGSDDCNLAANYLRERLPNLGIKEDTSSSDFVINMAVDTKTGKNDEYYKLNVNSKGVTITGKSGVGVLDGVKTLIAALQRSEKNTLPAAAIEDYPDFTHRGLMLDVSRNYTTYENTLNLIDRLAEYKINVFQYHFSDDEAWRLEIPGLPELTEVGSRKGFTLNDYKAGFLMPTFFSTGNPDDGKEPANGYVTRDQFVEMLKYATARGVKIIPEVETPGHARAAIVSMRHRYDKYIDTDPEEAERYRCFDLTDTAKFVSAQAHTDNILNPALPGTYRLIQKVVKELESMYTDAGLHLDAVHIGGDEVPRNCWTGSQAIKDMMEEKGYKEEHEVAEHFTTEVLTWMAGEGIKVYGWQEIAAHHSDEFAKSIAPMLGGVNVWSTLGKDINLCYGLANIGVPVILSNVNTLYLDLQYRPHEYESGLSWGGCVDEIISWETLPCNIYRSARIDYAGNKANLDDADKDKPKLEKPANIVGIQAQLWAETIRNYDMVQSAVFPKVFGLVERGWNSRPDWGEGKLNNDKYLKARAQYNLKIGLKELPYLHSVGTFFHLAQPGAIIEDGKLKVNVPYPGVVARYTLDGSNPTAQSPVWTAPVEVGDAKMVKVKAYYLDKESVATRLEVE